MKDNPEQIKRQGLNATIDELRKLADKLEKQGKEECEKLGIDYGDFSTKQRFLIFIINKEPECSDTWKIEK